MGKFIAAVVLLGFLGRAVGSTAPVPACFEAKVPPPQHTAAEVKALATARERAASLCGLKGVQCEFSVRSGPEREISVGVMRARLFGNPLECNYHPGDFEIQVYSASGNYLRTIPGL